MLTNIMVNASGSEFLGGIEVVIDRSNRESSKSSTRLTNSENTFGTIITGGNDD
jgi:hypothetical protein